MPRQKRIQFPNAIYHILARGNRRENIVYDEGDRRVFLETLEELIEKTGWVLFAWALMPNHYHLAVKTPEANLVRGMTWFQSTLTKRLNFRQKKIGHLFAGRYKSLLVEENEYLTTLIYYLHLNPVRAGLCPEGEALEKYEWSSLRDYVGSKKKRRSFVAVAAGLKHLQLEDSSDSRQQLLEMTLRIARQEGKLPKDDGLGVQMKRGWLYGSEAFAEKMTEKLQGILSKEDSSNGYTGQQQRDYGEQRAHEIIRLGLNHFSLTQADLKTLKKGDWRKAVIVARIRRETTMNADWISQQLHMGTRSSISIALRKLKTNKPALQEIKKFNKLFQR